MAAVDHTNEFLVEEEEEAQGDVPAGSAAMLCTTPGQGQGGRSQPRTSGRDAAEGAQPTPGADEAQQQDPGDTPEPLDAHRLAQRQKQVDFGKNTLGYQRYLQLVPKERRGHRDPATPDVHQRVSKRCFDGQVKAWRRQLHRYDTTGGGPASGVAAGTPGGAAAAAAPPPTTTPGDKPRPAGPPGSSGHPSRADATPHASRRDAGPRERTPRERDTPPSQQQQQQRDQRPSRHPQRGGNGGGGGGGGGSGSARRHHGHGRDAGGGERGGRRQGEGERGGGARMEGLEEGAGGRLRGGAAGGASDRDQPQDVERDRSDSQGSLEGYLGPDYYRAGVKRDFRGAFNSDLPSAAAAAGSHIKDVPGGLADAPAGPPPARGVAGVACWADEVEAEEREEREAGKEPRPKRSTASRQVTAGSAPPPPPAAHAAGGGAVLVAPMEVSLSGTLQESTAGTAGVAAGAGGAAAAAAQPTSFAGLLAGGRAGATCVVVAGAGDDSKAAADGEARVAVAGEAGGAGGGTAAGRVGDGKVAPEDNVVRLILGPDVDSCMSWQ